VIKGEGIVLVRNLLAAVQRPGKKEDITKEN